MFRQQRQLRRWALRVLWVWLLGLGLGVANACLADQQFAAGGATFRGKTESLAAGLATVSAGCEQHPDAVPAPASHDPHDASAKSVCESFCERASLTVPPQKSVSDSDESPVLPLPMAALTVPAFLAVAADVRALRRDGARARPIPIVFLRLTL